MAVAVAKNPDAQVVRLRFRSDVNHILPAVDRIMSAVTQSGCVLGQEIGVELALYEALSNAVVHGNHCDPDTCVQVRCSCDPVEGISIVVRDQGRGFDPGLAPDTTAPDRLLNGQGRGLLIMRSYMDAVSFHDGGRELHLWKDAAVAPIRSTRPAQRAPKNGGLDEQRWSGPAARRGRSERQLQLVP